MRELTRLGSDTNTRSHLVAKGARHGQPRDVFALQPHAQRANRVLVWVAEGVDAATAGDYTGGLVVLAGLLVTADGLGHDLALVAVLDNYAAGVTNINAEELLSEGHDADASGAGEANVHHTAEQLLVAVQEGVVKGDANLVSVQSLIILLLKEVIVVFLEHEAHLGLDELGQALLHVARDLAAELAVAIGHREEVAVLEAAEVRHRNPGVLVLLVRVRGRLACLCSERELRHAVGVHLARVGRVVGVLLLVSAGLLLLLWLLSALR